MTCGRLLAASLFASFAAATSAIPAEADCTQLPTNLQDGQPAHAQDVFDYIRSCPYFTGKMGIGISSPEFKVEVIAPNDGIRILSGASSSYSRLAIGRVSHELSLGVASKTGQYFVNGILPGDSALVSFGNLKIGSNATSSPTMTLTDGGVVGIGTTTPSYKLDVNGTIRADNVIPPSDARLKSDVRPLPSEALAKIAALRPVTFRWKSPKDDGMKGPQMGLIAQEVEKVLPTTVLTARDAMKTKGIKYNEIAAVLIKAVQEQQEEIAALRAENVKLRRGHTKQIADLNARLDRLEHTRLRFAKMR